MIHFINQLGADMSDLTWAMLLQSTCLAAALLVFDLILGRRLRSSLRYGLWLLFVVKLVLPPSLSLPTGIGYWLGPKVSSPAIVQQFPSYEMTITDVDPAGEAPSNTALNPFIPPKSHTFSGQAKLLLAWVVGALLLSLGMLARNTPVRRLVREATPASAEHRALLRELSDLLGLRRIPGLCLSRAHHSPAVCGLFKPVIVIPSTLAEELSPDSLRLVLLHELIHICRRDLWANRLQALVQVLWWWNPIVWMVNSHIRTLREQAVDEAVMLSIPHDRTVYPSTLVKVARHCATRPMLALSFLGIFESRRTLRFRVKRLLNIDLPRSANLGWSGWITLVAAAFLVWPMAFHKKAEASPADHTGNPLVVAQAEPGSQDGVGETLDTNQLFTRIFQVDREVFLRNIDKGLGPSDSEFADSVGTIDESAVQQLLRTFIEFAGVDIPVPNPLDSTPEQSQKAVFYDHHTGSLFVRATQNDMEAIEQALHSLSFRTATIMMEVQFIEMEASEPRTLGFDWFSRISRQDIASGTSLTDSSLRPALPTIPSGGVFPQLSGPVTASTSTAIGATGILTDEEYRLVLKSLNARPGTRQRSRSKVSTRSGRQAQLSHHNPIMLMNEDGTTYTGQTGNVVDVIPTIAEDNYSIQLILTAGSTVWKPDAGDKPTIGQFRDGQFRLTPVTSGTIQRAQLNATALVSDGQTLALFGHVMEHPVTAGLNPPHDHPDIVPTDRRIVVFVTPTLIDGKGNRIYTSDQGK